jgi:hypothetical protein
MSHATKIVLWVLGDTAGLASVAFLIIFAMGLVAGVQGEDE